jgi:hypothetical protein
MGNLVLQVGERSLGLLGRRSYCVRELLLKIRLRALILERDAFLQGLATESVVYLLLQIDECALGCRRGDGLWCGLDGANWAEAANWNLSQSLAWISHRLWPARESVRL